MIRRFAFPNQIATFFALLFVVTGAGPARSTFGGKPIEARMEKYVVAIRIDRGDEEHYCSGSLIGPDLILSAAHCFATPWDKAWVYFVKSGMRYDDVPVSRVRAVLRVAMHPKYDKRSSEADLAVLRLAERAPAGTDPIVLDSHNITAADIEKFRIQAKPDANGRREAFMAAGIGAKHFDGTITGDPRYIYLYVKSGRVVGGTMQLELDQSFGQGICQGDSGGPIFIDSFFRVQFGVVSFVSYRAGGPETCEHTSSIIWVGNHIDWIKDAAVRMGTALPRDTSKDPTPRSLHGKWNCSFNAGEFENVEIVERDGMFVGTGEGFLSKPDDADDDFRRLPARARLRGTRQGDVGDLVVELTTRTYTDARFKTGPNSFTITENGREVALCVEGFWDYTQRYTIKRKGDRVRP